MLVRWCLADAARAARFREFLGAVSLGAPGDLPALAAALGMEPPDVQKELLAVGGGPLRPHDLRSALDGIECPLPQRRCRMAPDTTTTAERAASSGSASGTAPLLRDFVGGAWVDSRATSSVDVYNPATGAVIARSPLGTRADVDAAVAAAKAAFPGLARHARGRARARDVRVQEPPRGALRRDRTDRDDRARQDAGRVARLRAPRDRGRRGRVRDAVDDDGLRPRGHRARARLRRPPPADGRLRGDRAVQLPRDGPAVVPPLRGRDRATRSSSSPPSSSRSRRNACTSSSPSACRPAS